MNFSSVLRLLVIVILPTATHQLMGQERLSPVSTCTTITNARPHNGVAYAGVVTNGDYRFSVTIPKGFTGWGAGPGAPFHGFVIFLGDAQNIEHAGCIGLGVQLAQRFIIPEEAPVHDDTDPKAHLVKIGNRKGVQKTVLGTVNEIPTENLEIFLELPREGYANSFSVTLVTPLNQRRTNERIFRSFVASIRFY
jgi:hypothetical protein